MPNKKIIVTEKNSKERLDKFLAAELDMSRSQAQKLIIGDRVLVNKKRATKHYSVKEKDTIEIIDQNIQEKSQATKKPTEIDSDLFKKIEVVAERDDFLIIEKPSGLLVHPTSKNEANTLVDWLISKYPELIKLGEDPARAAIVHRLDKDVSGLMIIPRTQDAFEYFKLQFKLRKPIKKYTALVYGEIERNFDEINFPIGRSKTRPGVFAARPNSQDNENLKNRNALTRFDVKKRFKNYTLLEVEILTGRTHQIRVHMLAYGHPIVGDPLYTYKGIGKISPGRILLHAHYLSFVAPDGTKEEFNSKLPKKFDTTISRLINI